MPLALRGLTCRQLFLTFELPIEVLSSLGGTGVHVQHWTIGPLLLGLLGAFALECVVSDELFVDFGQIVSPWVEVFD